MSSRRKTHADLHAPSRPVETSDELDELINEGLQDPDVAAAFIDAESRKQWLRQLSVLRKGSKISQAQLAIHIGTTQSAISDIEHARVDVRLSTLQRYARGLGKRLEVRWPSAHESRVRASDLGGLAISRTLQTIVASERQPGALTGRDMASRSGLTDETLGHTIANLRSRGWLIEVTDASDGRELGLNPERAAVIGVSVRADHVAGVVTDLLASQSLARARTPLVDTSPKSVVRAIGEVVSQLRATADQRLQLLGLGVELAGHVEGETGIVRFAPDLATPEHSWGDVHLEDEVQGATQLRTVAENDANALAVYEYLRFGASEGPLAVVLLSQDGEGIGCGVISKGDVLHGVHGVSCEIGHLTADPNGRRCRCQNRGCVETVSSPIGILRSLKAALGRDVADLGAAAELVALGETVALFALADGGRALGAALASFVTFLQPARIVIYGPKELVEEDIPQSSGHVFMGGVREGLRRAPFDAKFDIEPKQLLETACTLGAAAVAVREFLRAPLQWVQPVSEGDEAWTEPASSLVEAARELQQLG